MRNHNGEWEHGFSGALWNRDIMYAKLFGLKTRLLLA